jgi:hypothetical protein
MAILGYNNTAKFIRAFGQEEWLKSRGLEGWLELATDKLEVPARERIAKEIEAHYAEAVNVHLATGESEMSAQAAALAELGDPQEASWNFQRSHLTESEAKWLQSMERAASRPLFSLRMLPVDVIPIAGLSLLCSNSRGMFYFRLAATGIPILIAFIGFRLVPRLLWGRTFSHASFLRGLALCYFITFVALVVCGLAITAVPAYDSWVLLNGAFIFYVMGYSHNPGLRIWNKLRKLGDKRDELPPQQSSAF